MKINRALEMCSDAYHCPDYNKHSEKVSWALHNGTLFIAFAGTDDWDDVFEDLNFRKKTIDMATGTVRVHSGFWNSWLQTRDFVLSLVARHQHHNIRFVGHSKGGAMALCAHLDIRYFLPKTILLTPIVFGCPRVLASDKKTRETIESEPIPLPLHCVNQGDPVTMLPRKYMGYTHWGIRKVKNSKWWQRIYLVRSVVHSLSEYFERFEGTEV